MSKHRAQSGKARTGVSPLRVVVVDDEAPARRKLQRYLSEMTEVVWVGEAANGHDAIRLIEVELPDLVLLDIQMPSMDGFEVLAQLDVRLHPRVIFVTAHDEHAVRAFEVAAVDYLLKPVDRDRFFEAINRARDRAISSQAAQGEERPGAAGSEAPITRFLVAERGRLLVVPVERITWIGSAGNYVEVHTSTGSHLVRGALTTLEERLPRDRFARVHRSHIVNLDYVTALHHWSHGDYMIVLEGGKELRLSRRYRSALGGLYGP